MQVTFNIIAKLLVHWQSISNVLRIPVVYSQYYSAFEISTSLDSMVLPGQKHANTSPNPTLRSPSHSKPQCLATGMDEEAAAAYVSKLDSEDQNWMILRSEKRVFFVFKQNNSLETISDRFEHFLVPKTREIGARKSSRIYFGNVCAGAITFWSGVRK